MFVVNSAGTPYQAHRDVPRSAITIHARSEGNNFDNVAIRSAGTFEGGAACEDVESIP